jgi:hypothetical protein
MFRDEATSAEPARTVMLATLLKMSMDLILPAISGQTDKSGDSLGDIGWTLKKRRFIVPRLPT